MVSTELSRDARRRRVRSSTSRRCQFCRGWPTFTFFV